MAHANARLTVHGRRLLVDRITAGHRPADVAAQLGCSRATAYKWLARFRAQGPAGLADRPSRPHRCPHRTPPGLQAKILQARQVHRRGADWIGAELGIPASTVGRVIARAGLPALADLDALTGEPVRRGPASRVRYERARPGELVHLDVKRVGRIPDGGGWRAHGRAARPALRSLGARHVLIRPHCPWTNGKVERFNRTLLREWAYSQVFASNAERAGLLPDWLEHYNTRRRHRSLGGLPPISRLSTTW